MRIGTVVLKAVPLPMGRRCAIALGVAFANLAVLLLLFRYDVLGVFVSPEGVSCASLGVPQRLCRVLQGYGAVRPFALSAFVILSLIATGIYDPRPLIFRLERSERSNRWLAVNAAGVVIFAGPYLLAAAGVPPASFPDWGPYPTILAATMMVSGLLLWLSDKRQLAGTLKPVHVFVLVALLLSHYAAIELQALAWDALRAATFKTATLLLKVMGEPVAAFPDRAEIWIGDFHIQMADACSGISGIAMVSAVMGLYILLLRRRLWVGRALLLFPIAAALSWLLNSVRIAILLIIGVHVSPQLALDGFHESAGWIAFSLLSGLMLFAAENTAWFHREGRPKPQAGSVTGDPVVAQIAPFAVLLVSSLAAGAAFSQPEVGYPLRAAAMAIAVLVFRRIYLAEIGRVDALPIVGGLVVAVVWLGVKAGEPPLSVLDLLGPVPQNTANAWIVFRVAGTVLLVPFIEEMFFRGYLLRQLDFGGTAGKITALILSSVLFGALHASVVLAFASGILFGLLAFRRGRIFDAVAAHATANAVIASWAVWMDNWSVI
jgi:uncharacterized protein